MTDLQQMEEEKLLGAGRSGQVFLVKDQSGKIARKVFFSDTLGSLVHYVLFGADNPYIWNQDFLECAYWRRKILELLVPYWFDAKLSIAPAIRTDWNLKTQSNQLDTGFVPGRNVALHQPMDRTRNQETRQLVHQVMHPLQKRLIEAGFDGLVWQAGKGNPVALNNFLVVDIDAQTQSFVWIDMESGVPALFPLNILTLFTFYLPKSFKHRSPLFDDVDIQKLKKYGAEHRTGLEEKLGERQYSDLVKYIDALAEHQANWKSLTRLERGIFSQLRQGKITQSQANWYLHHPARWYFKELKKLLTKSLKKLFLDLPRSIINKLRSLPYLDWIKGACKLIFSKKYRFQLTRNYVTERIHVWQDRKQLKPEDAEDLVNRLNRESGGEYLGDFGFHLGLKILVGATEFGIFPLLFAAGWLDEVALAMILLVDGLISRTVYTGFRLFQAKVERQELPWVALLIGMIPTMVGNLAYPCQIVYSASSH